MAEIPIELSRKTVAYLQQLPLVHDKNGRIGLLNAANLDSSLLNLVSFEEPTNIFFQKLVSLCIQYGQLNDGRHSLAALLEATKERVGVEKREYCDILQDEWNVYLTFRTLTCSIYIFFKIAQKTRENPSMTQSYIAVFLKPTPCFPSGSVADSQKHRPGGTRSRFRPFFQTYETLHTPYMFSTHP